MKDIILDTTILHDRADEINVTEENTLVREIVLNLKEIVKANNLVGLSAPQIGYNKRIFVINFKGDVRTFINPIITNAVNLTLAREKCVSLPGKEFIRPRHPNITVMYQTPLGKTESIKLYGKGAEVFQHQLDHLDGLLLNDIGLEVDEDFDNASEEEKNEIISAYLDSLDIKRKEVEQQIEEDPELNKLNKAIDFIDKLSKGEIEIKEKEFTTEDKDMIKEKIDELNNSNEE